MGAATDLVLAPPPEARIGSTLLGKWRLTRLIGLGGMGAIYEAEHRNQSRVAVKVLHRHASLSSAQLARFRREGYAANRVGHPGVVEVYDDDVDEHGSAFLVMELLTGQTVAELARAHGGALPPEQVLECADRLLDVLAAAHGREILHRDIKPENLFFTSTGELKVLDFGIARLGDLALDGQRTEAGTLLGTPAFSPPEQARGRIDEMDARSDLWAVGATMFTLLSGRHVHEAETPNEQLGLAMSATPPSLGERVPALPSALVCLVDRALAYERNDRWPDARTMQQAVRSVRGAWLELKSDPNRVVADWQLGPLADANGTPTLNEAAAASPLRSPRRTWQLASATLIACVGIGAASAFTARRELAAEISHDRPSAAVVAARGGGQRSAESRQVERAEIRVVPARHDERAAPSAGEPPARMVASRRSPPGTPVVVAPPPVLLADEGSAAPSAPKSRRLLDRRH